MRPGDVAGLALVNLPYALDRRTRSDAGRLTQFDQQGEQRDDRARTASRVWLRARCDFLTEQATLSYSTDGRTSHGSAGRSPWSSS